MSAGIYVHVPFCLTRCGYCDFNAYAGLDHLRGRYVAALAAGGRADGAGVVGRRVRQRVPRRRDADHARGRGPREAPARSSATGSGSTTDAEITIEANPDTVDERTLSGLLDAGYTRLSMGAQSFDRAVLAALERVHDPDSVRRAMRDARAAGYTNVNLDLIYGADGETLGSWERTLREAIELAPEHVSAYALTIEPSTAARAEGAGGDRRRARSRPPGGHVRARMPFVSRRPATATTRSRTGRSRASSACTTSGTGSGGRTSDSARARTRTGTTGGGGTCDRRRSTSRRVEAGRLPVGGEEVLEPSEAHLEEVFLRLRILEGVPASSVDPAVSSPFIESGLLRHDDGALVPTERGMLVLNELVLALAGQP